MRQRPIKMPARSDMSALRPWVASSFLPFVLRHIDVT